MKDLKLFLFYISAQIKLFFDSSPASLECSLICIRPHNNNSSYVKAFDPRVAALLMGQLQQLLSQAAPSRHTAPVSSVMDCRMHMTTVKNGLLC